MEAKINIMSILGHSAGLGRAVLPVDLVSPVDPVSPFHSVPPVLRVVSRGRPALGLQRAFSRTGCRVAHPLPLAAAHGLLWVGAVLSAQCSVPGSRRQMPRAPCPVPRAVARCRCPWPVASARLPAAPGALGSRDTSEMKWFRRAKNTGPGSRVTRSWASWAPEAWAACTPHGGTATRGCARSRS